MTNGWLVTQFGRVVGSHSTEAEAMAHASALDADEAEFLGLSPTQLADKDRAKVSEDA